MYTLLKNNNKRFFKLLLNHNKIRKHNYKTFLNDKIYYINNDLLIENPYYNFDYHYRLRLIKNSKYCYDFKYFKSLKIKKMSYLRKSKFKYNMF